MKFAIGKQEYPLRYEIEYSCRGTEKRTLPQNSNPVLLGRAGEKQKNQPAHIVEKILEGLTRSRSAVPRKSLTVGTVKLANIRNGIRILVLQGEVVQLSV
jgi:hypothetical protein